MTQALEMMLVMLRVAKVYQIISQRKAKTIKTLRDLVLLKRGLKEKKAKD